MSDSPLADWLRERGAWPGDVEAGTAAVSGDPPPDSVLAAVPPGGAAGEGPALPSASREPAGEGGGPSGWEGGGPSGWEGGGPSGWEGGGPSGWDGDERPGGGWRRRLLLGLAIVPWLGFAAVALGGLGERDDPAAAGHDPAAEQAPAPAGEAGNDRGVTAGDHGGEHATSSRGPTAPEAASADPASSSAGPPGTDGSERLAGAIATVAVRSELTGPVEGDGPTARYVDLAVPESIEWVGSDVAVVAVAALVLEGDDDAWNDARPARFAVTVRVSDGEATPLGPPWPLPPHEVGPPPSWEGVADESLVMAVGAALEDGGYREAGDIALSRSPDIPDVLLAEVVAVAPGETAPGAHAVWLRDGDPPTLFAADR